MIKLHNKAFRVVLLVNAALSVEPSKETYSTQCSRLLKWFRQLPTALSPQCNKQVKGSSRFQPAKS